MGNLAPARYQNSRFSLLFLGRIPSIITKNSQIPHSAKPIVDPPSTDVKFSFQHPQCVVRGFNLHDTICCEVMIVTPSQLFCLTRDPVTRIRVFSFLVSSTRERSVLATSPNAVL